MRPPRRESAAAAPVAARAVGALVHGYTATGAICALAALLAGVDGDAPLAFTWLALQVAIDSSDGWLARRVRVAEVLPRIDGGKLDDIVDYLCYAFVPAVLVTSLGLVPGVLGWAVAAGMLVSSAMGFSRTDAKTADHFFTGFPSYWNIVVLYLVAFECGPLVSTLILTALVALVFVPIRYVYPSRSPVLRPVTLTLGLIWAGLTGVVIATLPDVPAPVLYGSLLFPAYYVGLSLVLEWQRRRTTELPA